MVTESFSSFFGVLLGVFGRVGSCDSELAWDTICTTFSHGSSMTSKQKHRDPPAQRRRIRARGRIEERSDKPSKSSSTPS